jgi:hypothetical protein
MRIVFLLLLVTYGYFVPPVSWNGNSRFDLTRAIVEEQRLSIDSFHHNTGDKALARGHYYTDKAPGVSLLAVPAYAIFYATLQLTNQPLPSETPAEPGKLVLVNRSFSRGIYVATLSAVSLWSALAGAVLFGFLRARGVRKRDALAVTCAYALATPILPYSTMLYGHAVAAAQLWLAYTLLEPWAPPGPAGAPPLLPMRAAAAGVLAGLAVLCEYPAAVPALLFCWLAHRRGGPRALGALCLGGAPLACILVAYHTLAFGGPLTTGYGFVVDPMFAGQHQGFFGISLPDPGALVALLGGRLRGLFYVAPVLLVAAAGVALVCRTPAGRRQLALPLAICAYFVLLNASYYMWWGGSAFGPRHLLPMLPFLVLGLPAVLDTRYRFAFWPLLALSIANALGATAVGAEAPPRGDVLADHVWSYILAGRVAVENGTSNLGLVLRLRGLWSLLPLLAIWIVGVRVVMQDERA